MTKWIHGQQLVWEKHQPLSGAWLTVKRMYFKVDGVAVLEDILTWEKDPADIWNSIKLVQLPRQKIRSSINGQSAKHVNFQHCNDVLLWVMRKWKSCYHENMLFCTDDYPGDDLKTRALAFLISEWRDPIKLEMSDFSWNSSTYCKAAFGCVWGAGELLALLICN